jgi:hypothetical protein
MLTLNLGIINKEPTVPCEPPLILKVKFDEYFQIMKIKTEKTMNFVVNLEMN